MADLKAMAESLVNLTVKEVNELADILKEEYGIEPAAAAAVAVAAPAGGDGGDGGPRAYNMSLLRHFYPDYPQIEMLWQEAFMIMAQKYMILALPQRHLWI